MEIGSPKYLRQAVTKVKNSGIMTDKEKVILTIASEIMSTVWVSETTYIEKPKDISPNVYTEAIATAKSGLYDENTGKYDFFTTVLPSLVLFSSSTDTSYYPQALEDLNSALKMNENSVLVLYMLGYLHESMGNYSEALKMYSRAIELDRDCFECCYRAINVKLSLGNYGDVYREAENLLKKYPQNLDLLKLCAKSSYYVGDYAKAASLYDSCARELSGTVLFGRAKLGAAASVAMVDPAKGKAQLKAVYDDAEISPAYRAQAGYLLGLLEKSSGNIEAAKSIFKAMSENESFGMYSRVAEESLNEIN